MRPTGSDPDRKPTPCQAAHPQIDRRTAIQVGASSILGFGMSHLAALRRLDAAQTPAGKPKLRAKSVIYIFLSGGLSQIDSFDMKPEAKTDYRGEFKSIATKTPGLRICEHLPMLAARSEKWSIVRSLTHPFNEHSQGHMVMLSGRSDLPPAFDLAKPKSSDWPSIPSLVSAFKKSPNNLPPALVLPEKLVHRTGRVIPGQFGGVMGEKYDPWFVEASMFNPVSYGAFPTYDFHHERGKEKRPDAKFHIPQLSVPQNIGAQRFGRRMDYLNAIKQQQRDLAATAEGASFGGTYDLAVSLLSDERVRKAFDVHSEPAERQDAYGRNSFGWSLLMAANLVEQGVPMVQVNLGNNEAWDNHQAIFKNLKDFLFPPTDRAVAALLDDLQARGLLDETLIVMAGEFGRTPKMQHGIGKYPGRDHWGAVQTVWFAGGGVQGGRIIGSSDADGAYPKDDPQKPENMAATIYSALGIPSHAVWHDLFGRPHELYINKPIPGLT